MGDLGGSDGTEFSPIKGARTHASHTCSVDSPVLGVLTEGAKSSL